MAIVLALIILIATGQGIGNPAADQPESFRWLPPELTDPQVVHLGNGPTYNLLERDRDYIVVLPEETKVGNTMLEGGRNIVIMGGHITVPAGGVEDSERRGLYIKNAFGTVHVEGLLIDGVEPRGFDGISISAPRAIVQLVNIRVEGITGRFDGFHGDIVQPFGGVAELRIDHLSGTSNYQGFYLEQTRGKIGSVSISNVDLSYENNVYDETTYLIWLPVDPDTCSDGYPVNLENVFVQPRDGQRAAGNAVWPNSSVPSGCTAERNGEDITWPDLPTISGAVTEGIPEGGSFVPQGAVGIAYRSTRFLDPGPSGRAVGTLPNPIQERSCGACSDGDDEHRVALFDRCVRAWRVPEALGAIDYRIQTVSGIVCPGNLHHALPGAFYGRGMNHGD